MGSYLAVFQCAAILLAGPAPAADDLVAARGDARWLPGLSGFSGAMTQDSNATVDSNQRGFHKGDALAVFAYIGLSAELMTPALEPRFGAPRLFLHGDIMYSFDSEESIAHEGDPGTVRIPFIDNNGDGISDGEAPVASVMGRGSATKAEVQPWTYSAGAGVAFTFEAFGRPMRVKPSLEWLYRDTDVTGIVGDAEAVDGGEQCPCRTVLVETDTTEGFHYLGAGLELEYDAARTGSIMLSVFGSGQAYHVLGDREVELSASGSFMEPVGPPIQTLDMRSTYELEPWHYRIAFGLRFRWHPE